MDMKKLLLSTAALVVMSTVSVFAYQQHCTQTCYWLGNQQICNTYCY
jgi:hypothetical protein